MSDDGGSSGRLRREMGVLPPGDLRNNIAALADDESLMTKLLQYRFEGGELAGHSFGNLFIAALSDITGGMDHALTEVSRVLNLRGRVLPATLESTILRATVFWPDRGTAIHIEGESQITAAGGRVERVDIQPPDAKAYPESVKAILEAQLVVIGPGSLYTSILPSLLVPGILEALRASSAAQSDSLSSACVGCVTNAQIASVAGSKITGSVTIANNAVNASNATTATNALNLGNIAANQYVMPPETKTIFP